jgi:hypothetical protein
MRLLQRQAQTKHIKFSTFLPGYRFDLNMNSICQWGILVAIERYRFPLMEIEGKAKCTFTSGFQIPLFVTFWPFFGHFSDQFRGDKIASWFFNIVFFSQNSWWEPSIFCLEFHLCYDLQPPDNQNIIITPLHLSQFALPILVFWQHFIGWTVINTLD